MTHGPRKGPLGKIDPLYSSVTINVWRMHQRDLGKNLDLDFYLASQILHTQRM